MPDWIQLTGPTKTGQNGLAWHFRLQTDEPGDFLASLRFDCDSGVGSCQVSMTIKAGAAPRGDLVFCDSPFDCHTTYESLKPLVRILDSLPFRVHSLQSLAELGDLDPRTILLHQAALLRCTASDVTLLQQLVSAGVNLLVLADEFYRGTTSAANRVLSPFGLRMKQDGTEEPGISHDERLRRLQDWCARYDQTPSDCGPKEILSHPLTEGVRRLYWHRPCPVVCTDGMARPLVASPSDGTERFAAVSQPNGYVVALGKSLWSGFSSVGWPYDNARFLANLLVGGDAEAMVSEG